MVLFTKSTKGFLNRLFIILATFLVSGCSYRGEVNFAQLYSDRDLESSDICWIVLGNVYNLDGADVGGHIYVIFEENGAMFSNTAAPNHIRLFTPGQIPRPIRIFALPSGKHKFWISYCRYSPNYQSKIESQQHEYTKELAGGKCYEIEGQQFDMEKILYSYQFRIRERECKFTFTRGSDSDIHLYKLGRKENGKLGLIGVKKFDILDSIFKPFRSQNREGKIVLNMPSEFVTDLY